MCGRAILGRLRATRIGGRLRARFWRGDLLIINGDSESDHAPVWVEQADGGDGFGRAIGLGGRGIARRF